MITMKVSGGLGNQMFQYAVGRALALRHDTELLLDPLELLDPMPRRNAAKRYYVLDEYFKGDFPLIASARFFKAIPIPYLPAIIGKIYPSSMASLGRFKHVVEKKSFVFEPFLLELNENIYLDGGWISPKYFEGYEAIIRKEFAFRRELSAPAAALSEKIKNANAVALHIRRGDRIWSVDAPKYSNPAQADYDAALDLVMQKAGRDITVFIFSDDVAWCRDNFKITVPHVFVAEGHEAFRDDEDLELMTLCRHFILASSTFSWWGAWLSQSEDKVVIAPRRILQDETIDFNDTYPPEWLRMS